MDFLKKIQISLENICRTTSLHNTSGGCCCIYQSCVFITALLFNITLIILVYFYAPLKHKKTRAFLMFFRGYRKMPLTWNRLIRMLYWSYHSKSIIHWQYIHCTENEVFVKEFFSKCDQIRRKLRIWLHLLKKTLMKNLVLFCVVINQISVIAVFAHHTDWFIYN